MTTPLCTTLLSSYKRPALLMLALESLNRHADRSQYQIIVRLSFEDETFRQQAEQIMATHSNATVLVGWHGGYISIGDYFTESATLATGKWVHIFDDDMTMEGDWWSALKNAPDRHMVLCENYTCGGSGYGPGSCNGSGIGWFAPNGCWRELGEPGFRHPPDVWMLHLLVHRNGWPIHLLGGTRLNHQWQRPTDGNR